MKYFLLFISCALFAPDEIHALFPINIFQPYDIHLMPEPVYGSCYDVMVGFEKSINFDGFRDDSDNFGNVFCNRGNVLQLYQDDISLLGSLASVSSDPQVAKILARFMSSGLTATSSHLVPSAHLDVRNAFAGFFVHLPHHMTFSAYVPFISMKLSDVTFTDITGTNTLEDARIKEFLMPRFHELMQQFGAPSLDGWERSGVGDFTTMMSWFQDFPQAKPSLKNVLLMARFAITWPTGKEQDEDLLLAMPFGNDGAVGMIFGGGLDLTFASCLRAGGYIEFLHQFNNTKLRRVKTDVLENDLFYLMKAVCTREHGGTQQFNLYLEGQRFWRNVSARVAYQYFKKREDRLWFPDNAFDVAVANTAENLQDATFHNIIFLLKYEMDPYGTRVVSPEVCLFAKHGFNGKRALVGNTFGFTFNINF